MKNEAGLFVICKDFCCCLICEAFFSCLFSPPPQTAKQDRCELFIIKSRIYLVSLVATAVNMVSEDK